MSMLGLSVGVTGRISIVPVSISCVRMSLALDATIRRSIGSPICVATNPARTLPKLPVGTLNAIGREPRLRADVT